MAILKSKSGYSFNTSTGVRTNPNGSQTQVRAGVSEANKPAYNAKTGATSGKASKEYTDYLKSLNKPSSPNYRGEDGAGTIPGTIAQKPVAQIPTVPVAQPILKNTLGLAQTVPTSLDQQEADLRGEKKTNFESMLAELVAPPSTASIYEKARKEAGILQKQKEVSDLSERLNQIVSGGEAAQLKVVGQGRGIPEAIIGGQQAEIGRETAIASLPVSAQLSAAQGNLEMAQQNVETLFKIRSEDAQAKYEYENKVINAIYDFQDKEIQGKLDNIKEQKDRAYKEEQAEKEDIKKIAMTAAQNGASSNVIDGLSKVKTFEEALAIASPFLKTPSTDIVKLDDGSTLLIDKNTGKIISNLDNANTSRITSSGIPTQFSALVNTVSSLETTVAGKKSVANQMNQYIKNQDYSGAYNQIANTVAQGLTGDVKNRFENARIDREVLSGFKTAIEAYAAGGGDMGLLKGTAEEISRKLGAEKNPALTSLAVQLEREFQAYRNTMTGAAFAPKESREYAAVNPNSKKSIDLNLAVIDGALNQLNNRVDGTIRAKVPQAVDIKKLLDVPKTTAEAKKKVDTLYISKPEIRNTIDSLFNSGKFDDQTILEYLQNKGLIK